MDYLKTVPYGYTVTYGEISRMVGPGAPAQAVGQAVGHNKIAIIIPCHRVIGAGGKLTGYAGGLDRKRWLLGREEPKDIRSGRLFFCFCCGLVNCLNHSVFIKFFGFKLLYILFILLFSLIFIVSFLL